MHVKQHVYPRGHTKIQLQIGIFTSTEYHLTDHYSHAIFLWCLLPYFISPGLCDSVAALRICHPLLTTETLVKCPVREIKREFKLKLTQLLNFNERHYNDTNWFLTDRHNKIEGIFCLNYLLIECIYIEATAKYACPFCGVHFVRYFFSLGKRYGA